MRFYIYGLATAFSLVTVNPAMASVTLTSVWSEGVSNDVFEGANVTTTSTILPGFVAQDTFGVHTPSPLYLETTTGGHTIFQDMGPVSFINFQTATPTTIVGFNAYLVNDGNTTTRGFSGVALLGSNDGGATYVPIDSTTLNPNYVAGYGGQGLLASFSFAPVTYQYYRFEGTGAGDGRILELDGIAAVPEPATWGMMILGFMFTGVALRRRPAQRFIPA